MRDHRPTYRSTDHRARWVLLSTDVSRLASAAHAKGRWDVALFFFSFCVFITALAKSNDKRPAAELNFSDLTFSYGSQALENAQYNPSPADVACLAGFLRYVASETELNVKRK